VATLPIIRQSAPSSKPPVPRDTLSEGERRRLAAELAAAVQGEVRFDLHNRMLYATDASLYQVTPLGVVIPATLDDAVRAVEFCSLKNLPILPRGGGTSLAGQCVNEAVVLDFSARCRDVVELNDGARTCIVQPGITVDDLNDRLAVHRLFFPPDPATSRQANVGGCIGNNAAGARSIMYGRTSENLLGIEAAVLSESGVRRFWLDQGAAARDPLVRDLTLRVAEIVQRHERLIRERFPKTVRRNAGYNLDLILQQMDSAGPDADADAILRAINLSHLVCGSEGTLAVTLQARLKLQPLPIARGLAVVGFASLDEAIDAVQPILATHPSAVELLDDTVLDLASANTEYRRYVELIPTPREGQLRAVLYVEYFASETAGELHGRFAHLQDLIRSIAPTAQLSSYTDATAMASAWKLRKAGEPLLHGMPGDRKPLTFVEDNAVPVENLSRFVREFRAIVQRHGTSAAFWAHASVGVLHVRPFLDIRDPEDQKRLQAIAVEVADLARSLGGVMSGEHGDGRVRGPLLERFYGPELMAAFGEIKAVFDPRNLLNPGNIVAPGPITSIVERTRIQPLGPFVDVPPVDTYFDYEDQHGFRGAVEMCNGAGVCRKKAGGTMCPSYMATLDERHATRGRGNALRLAITGQLRNDGNEHKGPLWNDEGTLETLDLCLSCKACKTECPSNVDIARLKAEYTAQSYRASGSIPARARFFGHVRLFSRFGSILPGLANWCNRQAPVRTMLNRAFELAPQRSIPEFCRPLTREFKRRTAARLPADAPSVAIFADCFTTYNEAPLGLTAARVLEAFGYRVTLLNAGCCARAMISTGLLDDAARTADRTLRQIASAMRQSQVAAILVLEPSCLSAIKDDWLELKLQTPLTERQRIASMSFLVEEFLERHWDDHPIRPGPSAPGDNGPVILHGHCHQKALWGAQSSGAVLRRLVGDRLRILDTGCCGMAGSFGYSAHKYDLSMKIGELSLFPAVRAAGDDAQICAPGTSCRHQIRDGTGRAAHHPVETIAKILGL
jgi:FAD/FMN-containing dehydrogenase/Fe-S oxidoreductase